MRPPHKAGDNLEGFAAFPDQPALASMRPPHKAGDNTEPAYTSDIQPGLQ